MIKYKKGFQISFAWLFAIIVGAFILFLAIYGVTKILNTGGDITSVKSGVELGILLDPLETNFESDRIVPLKMPVETRIYNKYDLHGDFGKQIIQVSQKNLGKFSLTDVDVSFQNKYIFSESVVEGKNFLIFSKPFEFPFKVADLIYLISSEKTYCFVNAPEKMEKELLDLNQKNLIVGNCSAKNEIICFDEETDLNFECNTNVYTGKREVKKGVQTMFFETDALMYAAIFSDKGIYEAQIKRLMKRMSNLLSLYEDKALLLSAQECPMEVNFLVLKNIANNVQISEDIFKVANAVDNLKKENENAICRLW